MSNGDSSNNDPKLALAIGDSIAVGLNGAIGNGFDVDPQTSIWHGHTIAKQGIGPSAVLSNINALLTSNPTVLRGQAVALSGGVSNNPSQIGDVATQISALTQSGASVVLIGVSITYHEGGATGANLNAELGQIADTAGAAFAGGFESGPDNVHPKSYRAVLQQAIAAMRASS
jgi:hypothetical protein